MKARKINEDNNSFQRNKNPLNSMGLGVLPNIKLKLLNTFEGVYLWGYKSADGWLLKNEEGDGGEIQLDIENSENVINSCIDFKDILNTLNINISQDHLDLNSGLILWDITDEQYNLIINNAKHES